MYYDHRFGDVSLSNLEGVLPALAQVAARAIQICKYDGMIISGGGMRTQAQADANVRAGTGIANSRHIKQADGYGHAIDLIALTPGKGIDWSNMAAFKAMAHAVKRASAELQVPIRQGCDWNMNGEFNEKGEYDWAHFEDPKPGYQAIAKAEMLNHRKELGLDVPMAESPVTEFHCPHCEKPIKVEAAG